MSLIFGPNSARLSVIGNGWNNVSFDSGNGFVFDDDLWKDLAFDLNFEFDPNLDFGELELPEFDFSDIIFDLDGTIYTEMDGVWKNPLTGAVYPGGGTRWITYDKLRKAVDALCNRPPFMTKEETIAVTIPQETIDRLFSFHAKKWTLIKGAVNTEYTATNTFSVQCPYYYLNDADDGFHITAFASVPFGVTTDPATFVKIDNGKPIYSKDHHCCESGSHNEEYNFILGGTVLMHSGKMQSDLFEPDKMFHIWKNSGVFSQDSSSNYAESFSGATKPLTEQEAETFDTVIANGYLQGVDGVFYDRILGGQILYGSYEKRMNKIPIWRTDSTIINNFSDAGIESRSWNGNIYYKV